ncbi:MAG: hybrid sensor histidine kinase/response regulator [Candidatus Acidiferrales bacterium]
MQSRFILMEGATVLLALFLMVGALILSVLIRSQFSSGVEGLHEQIALQSRIRTAFDATVLTFWRTDGSSDAHLLAAYRASSAELRTLTKQGRDIAVTEADQQEADNLIELENTFLAATERIVAEPVAQQENEAELNEVPKRELAVQNAFRVTAETQFENLRRATERVALYTRALRIVLLVLGLFPVVAMIWFRRAHQLHIWTPLERLHGMVLEVKRGNLDVHGSVPSTVELGSVTAAFLAMASELREMRDSLEEKVRQRAAQLEAAHKDLLRAAKLASLGQLISGVAHEINNPLTSILGFSEIVLANEGLEAPVRTQVRTIRDEALRLKHLVANLSQLSRRAPQQTHRLDLRTVPDRLLELRTYQLAANNIRVDYRRAEKPVWITGDRDALLQLMLQLVLNAEHAIRDEREAGEIRLTCEALDGHGLISVQDDGCGMASEMREHIFDPFFTTRPSRQGTGLGLSICHGIVEQHGGEITVESEVGRRTTFRIRLPLLLSKELGANPKADHGRADLAEADSVANSGIVLSPAASPRFLVIDDESGILNLVAEVLGNTGARVVTLQDSTRLDTVLGEGTFDAVLCDLKMPGRDGLSVLRTLREQYPDLARRFLLMTGNLADCDKAAVELEGIPILPKPFTLARLREMLDQITASSA